MLAAVRVPLARSVVSLTSAPSFSTADGVDARCTRRRCSEIGTRFALTPLVALEDARQVPIASDSLRYQLAVRVRAVPWSCALREVPACLLARSARCAGTSDGRAFLLDPVPRFRASACGQRERTIQADRTCWCYPREGFPLSFGPNPLRSALVGQLRAFGPSPARSLGSCDWQYANCRTPGL
jgi:hypothetical protein